MSDSEIDGGLPNDSVIETTLRDVVREAVKQDEEVTVKLARTRAEEKLGLEAGYLKSDADWKMRSQQIVQDAFDEPPSPEKPKKPASKPKAGAKRKSDDVVDDKKKKRRKASPVVDSDEPVDFSEEDADKHEDDASEPEPATKPKPGSKSTSALSSAPDTADEEAPAIVKHDATRNKAGEDDESELSSVIDDPPPKKKRQKKSDAKPTKAKAEKPAKPDKASKPEKQLSADEEEIKRLQSWLLKCGIRKLWHRELASCTTNKEKIKHLKGMLEEVGMTPRYSAEKAKQIKEQRELAAEIEAAKEFNDKWGQEQEDQDSEEDGKKRRRLKPKGLVDFGDSGKDSD